jgi:hypothetical protein
MPSPQVPSLRDHSGRPDSRVRAPALKEYGLSEEFKALKARALAEGHPAWLADRMATAEVEPLLEAAVMQRAGISKDAKTELFRRLEVEIGERACDRQAAVKFCAHWAGASWERLLTLTADGIPGQRALGMLKDFWGKSQAFWQYENTLKQDAKAAKTDEDAAKAAEADYARVMGYIEDAIKLDSEDSDLPFYRPAEYHSPHDQSAGASMTNPAHGDSDNSAPSRRRSGAQRWGDRWTRA